MAFRLERPQDTPTRPGPASGRPAGRSSTDAAPPRAASTTTTAAVIAVRACRARMPTSVRSHGSTTLTVRPARNGDATITTTGPPDHRDQG
jgi:hypothetical protein